MGFTGLACRLLPSCLAASIVLVSGSAAAADITFAVIGPHEYELPVNYEPFNAIVQYGEINSSSKFWNEQGHIDKGAGGALYEGLTKYVYFFDFKSIPNLGIAAEVIEPEVYVSDSSPHVSGLAGTIFGFALWTKPDKNSTFGVQSFGQAPDSTGKLTIGQTWNNLSSFLFDYQFKHFDVTGDLGIVFRTTQHVDNRPAVDQGNVFHLNLRAGWKVNPIVEPFVSVDWTSANSNYDDNTGAEVPSSGTRETALGGGINVKLSEKAGFAVRYSRGVEGHNTTFTDAAYFKIYYVF